MAFFRIGRPKSYSKAVIGVAFLTKVPANKLKSTLEKYPYFDNYANTFSMFGIGSASKTVILFNERNSLQNLIEPSGFRIRTMKDGNGALGGSITV